MASDINLVALSGRLTRDPELRHTPSGTAVLDLGLAFNSSRKVGDEWQEDPNFVDVTFFGNRAEFFADRLSKGSLVFVSGRLKWESWESENGKRSKIKVMGGDLKSKDLFGGGSGSTSSNSGDQFTPAGVPGDASDDDIPF